MLKEILDNKTDGHVSSGKFSISSIGSCLRKKYLEIKGEYKQVWSEDLLRLFGIGDAIHMKIVRELIEKGGAQDVHVAAAEVNIPNNKYFSGRIDMIISKGDKNYIVDIKSAGKFTMDRIRRGVCPDNYKNQVLLYMYFARLHNGILLFVDKVKGEIEEVEVEYNEEKAKKLVKDIETFFTEYIDKDIVPDVCDGKPFGCEVCYPKKR